MIKEYFDNLVRRSLLQLKKIKGEKGLEIEIDRLEGVLLMLFKPKLFSGKESAEIAFQKQFEEMCLFLSSNLNLDAGEMTVLRFYSSFEYLKKINKPKEGKKVK